VAARRGTPPPLGAAMMPEQAAEQAATAVLAERDAIQANLLELDQGFTRRLLDGAPLTGLTRQRWDTASAKLASLWETYMAYSAVVDRVAELGTGGRRPAKKDLPELTGLLTGTSVRLTPVKAPLARRDLADTGRRELTIAASVAEMRAAFSEVAEVTSAVETVWGAVGGQLDAAAEELGKCRTLMGGLGVEVQAEFRDAESSLDAQRAGANADPLALWHAGQVDTSAADRLRDQVKGLATRIAELDRLRAAAQGRIDALIARVAAARADRQEAVATWRRAAERITEVPSLPPDIADPPLAALSALATAGQWTRLQAEIDRCEAGLTAAAAQTTETKRLAEAALGRRDELRGLLGAYKAKASRLGAAEDRDLAERYDQARNLLWTAPCDLAVAAAAVTGYQQAISRWKGGGGGG
jgi:hypothetical protein